jgi:YidC/Oxa1 family membrane protein insertase
VHSGFRAGARIGHLPGRCHAPATIIAPGTADDRSPTRLFTGAKEVHTLDRYTDDLQDRHPHFGKASTGAGSEIVEKPIFNYLDWLFRMVGNFGVAIILLTIIIRGLMFPIAQRQFASMAGMRAIQPKMKALQERYKDDKPRQQQEMHGAVQGRRRSIRSPAACRPSCRSRSSTRCTRCCC